ncbi:MAG: glycosyltransferase family 9 protein [Candidatus Pacebacteria bacterium]|nr:glycosyltransferase family 9 protein [Candidatus Paceibacterota bacterium]
MGEFSLEEVVKTIYVLKRDFSFKTVILFMLGLLYKFICYFLYCLRTPWFILSRRFFCRDLKPVNKVLIVRKDNFGDLIITLKSTYLFKKINPNIELSIVCNEEFVNFIEKTCLFKKIYRYEKSLRLLKKIKADKYDTILIISPISFILNFLSFILKIPNRIGYNKMNSGLFLTAPVEFGYFPFGRKKPYCETVLDIFKKISKGELSLPEKIGATDLFLKNVVIDSKKNFLKQIFMDENFQKIIISKGSKTNPDTKLSNKRWMNLVRNLLKNKQNIVVIVGSKKEIIENKIFYGYKRIYNLTGKTNLIDLLYMLEHSDLLFSTDTGLNHLASLFPHVRKINFFGPSDPKIWGYLHDDTYQTLQTNIPCAPCSYPKNIRHLICKKNYCMSKKFLNIDKF